MTDDEHAFVLFYNSSGNDIAGTLDASYYKGQGERQGAEREYIVERIIEDNDCKGNSSVKILITLNDQGGGIINWNYNEISQSLRANMKSHVTTIVLQDDGG